MRGQPKDPVTIARLVLVISLAVAVVTAAAQERDPEATADANSGDEALEEIVVIGQPIRDEIPLSMTLTAEQLSRLAGTQDDPLRGIITLPGVAVNDDFEGGVAIRGSRPGDNRYDLDFLPVGYLFHLTGLSVVDGDLVDGFRLYPAGFGAEYQGIIGGVIDARTRAPKQARTTGVLDASILDAGVLVEGPISDRQRGVFSARVSYYDVILGRYIEEIREEDNEGVDIVQLPRYRDYRGKYQLDIGDEATLDVFIDGAADEVALLFDDSSSQATLDPAVAGSHRFQIDYDRIGTVLTRAGAAGSELKVAAGIVRRNVNGQFGDVGSVDTAITENTLKLGNRFAAWGRHEIKAGLNITGIGVDYDIVIRDNGCTEFDVDCRFVDDEVVTTRSHLNLRRTHAFIEDTIQLSEHFAIAAGVGFARDDYLGKSVQEPRLRFDWNPHPVFAASLSWGRYFQMPAFEYMEREVGNPRLDYLQAEHLVLGADLLLPAGIAVGVDLYEKQLEDLVTSSETVAYSNGGSGRAFGAELLVQKGVGRLTGWLSLSYSRSERVNEATGERFRFEFDQPVIASVIAKYEINERLDLSGRVAWHSGPPHTPILGGDPDPDHPGTFTPIYGELNSERLPDYARIDLRLDWLVSPARGIRVHFEVINATNHENVAGYEYSADYTGRRNVEQLPMFLSVGVRKEW